MEEIKLVKGECSHPPIHDDVSDDYISDFLDSDVFCDDDEMNSYHDSPLRLKWLDKMIP